MHKAGNLDGKGRATEDLAILVTPKSPILNLLFCLELLITTAKAPASQLGDRCLLQPKAPKLKYSRGGKIWTSYLIYREIE